MSTPKLRTRVAEWFVISAVLVITFALSGCSTVMDAIPAGGPIPQKLAEDYARLGAGASVAAIEIVSSRLSTYGQERPGGRAASPDTQVWSVTLKGAFPYGSCNLAPIFSTASPKPTYVPCPQPAARERMILDARNGHVIERVVPA